MPKAEVRRVHLQGCTPIVICNDAEIKGTVVTEDFVVDGLIEGPMRGTDVVLKSKARVKGSIHHQSLTIEKGAQFEGQAIPGNGSAKDTVGAKRELNAQPSKAAGKSQPSQQAAE